MSFEAFERSIRSPALKQVARHWGEVRGSRIMPGWTDIRPSAIKAQLPIVWSYVYDASTDTFTGRLAGSRIEQIFGKTIHGASMKEIYPEEHYETLFQRAKRVVCGPAMYLGDGMVFRQIDHFGYGERIMLPLASDGLHGDSLFGATDYKAICSVHSDWLPEVDHWFECGSPSSTAPGRMAGSNRRARP